MKRVRAIGFAVASLLTGLFPVAAMAAPSGNTSFGVEVQAIDLTGIRPWDGGTAVVDVKAVVEGEDASFLAGEGRVFGAGGAHGYWQATGSLVGNLLTLSGVLTESNIGLAGTPVELQANISTGAMTVTIGPWTALFPGQTVVVEGSGRVKIKTR